MVGEQIFLQLHHIVGQVKLAELCLEAILSEWETLIIISKFDLQGSREGLSLGGPGGQSFSTKLFDKKILVCIKQNGNAVLIGHPDYLPQCFEICVVVDPPFWFESLPCAVETDGVHAPMLEIVEVVISEGVVGVEVREVGVEGVDLVDCIYAVIDSISAVLVHKERVGGVHAKGEHQREQEGQ